MKEPKNGDICDNFLLQAIFFILTQRSSTFKTLLVVSIFRFQKWFDVDVLNFQFELWWDFGPLFTSIGQKLFHSSGHAGLMSQSTQLKKLFWVKQF